MDKSNDSQNSKSSGHRGPLNEINERVRTMEIKYGLLLQDLQIAQQEIRVFRKESLDPKRIEGEVIVAFRPYEKYIIGLGVGLGAYQAYNVTKKVAHVVAGAFMGGMYLYGCYHLGLRLGARVAKALK